MRKNKLLLLLVLLMTAATGARAAWTGGTYTATANENLGAITVNGDATLTINSDVTVTVTGGINVASGTLTVTGPGTLVVNGAKGNNGASAWEGGNGSNGGVAISGNIIVQGGATVTATGGNGGNGGTGAFVAGTGGNGGVAFAGKLTYKSGTVTANGGSAGSGGYIDDEERYASSGSAGKAFANDVDFTQTTGYSVTNGTSTIESVLNQTKVVISGGTEPAAAAGYTVSLKDGVKDADKWTVKVGEGQAQALPIGGLKGDGSETVTLQYTGRLKVKGVKATSEAGAPAAPTYNETKSINDGPVTVAAGEHWLITGTGTQTSNAILIAAGATVTLDGVNISTGGYCIKCAGDATIILKDGSTNTLTGTGDTYPALWIGDANTTLTIQGSTGVLNVTSGQYCAGIGGGYNNAGYTCGNIRIEGGVITAQGGKYAAGIGTDSCPATCGDIIITGGTITAKGGGDAAGIGSGASDIDSDPDVCGAITIANTVTKVTATKGANAPYSIGKGKGNKASCGTVTIGGTKYWENNAAVGDGATYLAQATIEYPAAAKEPATVTAAPTGAAIVGVGKTTALVSGGAAEGGTMMYKVTTENTKPASTDGFSATVPTAETITASGKVYVWYYVKGDDTHSDSEIAGPVSVTVTPALSLTNPVVGQVIGSDGKNYAAASVPSGVTKVAMIAYVSGSNGLAIALADEGSLNWATAKSTCEAKTPAFTNGTWHLPTQAEWNQMFSANGGDEESYTGLNTAINNAGGTTLQSGFYWSSSEYSPGVGAHLVHLDDGDADWSKLNETLVRKVRACLAFTVEQAAKPAATVTTAPTGAAIVGVGKTTALVSGGAAEGGTMMYKVTTENTKPTSTDGFSEAVPTAQGITASGKVYVWYYVKGDDTHSDSEIAATAIEVTVMAVPITVTWNPSDIVPKSLSDKSFTKDGITFTAATCDFQVLTFGGGGTFTTTLGNFTKIEISADFTGNVSGTGWTNDGWQSATWTGNAASVSFSGDIWGGGMTCEGGNLKIVFTIE